MCIFHDRLGKPIYPMHYRESDHFMKKAFGFLLLASALLFPACSTVEYNSTNAPRMVVTADRTPFFHNGPAQGNGPDLSLMKGDVVEVLRKEIGYSFVRIEDGQNGYVSNEDLKPATETTTSKPEASAKSSPTPEAKNSSTNQSIKPTFRY
jgi:uncharacterized protein YgiM (DUF1202 family)